MGTNERPPNAAAIGAHVLERRETNPMPGKQVEARVGAFIMHMWSKEARKERADKERVRVQTRRCMRVIQCEHASTQLIYGFVCDAWRDTVAVLRSTGVPPVLLFGPGVDTWEEVDEAAVQGLLLRVASDVVFRMRLLDACAASDPQAHAGQAWVTSYLATERWPRPPFKALPSLHLSGHGKVEQAFVTWAAKIKKPELLPYFFVWLHIFLVRAAQTHTFHPLVHGPVRWGARNALALAEELMAPPMSPHLTPHLTTMGLPDPCAPAVLAPHLPATTCGGYTVFGNAVRTIATRGTHPVPARQTRSRSPPAAAARKRWVRMTARSLLFPPMYLGPEGQLSFNLSE